MTLNSVKFWIRTLLITLSFGLMSVGSEAFARAGGKRSFGQRSHPTMQPRSPNPPQQPMQSMPQPASSRGSFMRGMAGGLAGGLLGSMLFSSFGHAAGPGGLGAGGVGFLDIILIAGLLYLAFRLWKSRQNRPLAYAGSAPSMASSYPSSSNNPSATGYFGQGLSSYGSTPVAAGLSRDTAEEMFFRVQGAWTRRDLNPIQDYIEPEVQRVLDQDLQLLKSRHEINRLENIAVRQVEISEPWWDGGRELVRVRFTASLLDYTVDELSGAVREGSTSEPVKFDEYWLFAKSQDQSRWRLAGIEQV